MNMILLGLAMAVCLGIGCRLLDLPLPAPPKMQGALLVLAMTLGFIAGDRLFG